VWEKYCETIKSVDIFIDIRFSSLPLTSQLRCTLVNLPGYSVFHLKFDNNNKDAAISGLLLEQSIISQLLKEFADTKAQHENMNRLQGFSFKDTEVPALFLLVQSLSAHRTIKPNFH
jgi:hypothetical protein